MYFVICRNRSTSAVEHDYEMSMYTGTRLDRVFVYERYICIAAGFLKNALHPVWHKARSYDTKCFKSFSPLKVICEYNFA